ncbi:MAG TPA: AbrB/MazE/SpoVT family DNA-binding domain-containing protein [Candidatus Nanoarchaeia archaeon]|nr:AbrB/MazE/SpoVT family DNA-binding domain-containing protein [Candidatus Nanoarchaeia archaeon]
MKHHTCVKEVRLGHKGQFTIPKKIRDEEHFEEDDTFLVHHTATGEILLRKKQEAVPEDALFKAIEAMPSFNFEQAWKEIKQERKKNE